MNEAHDPNRTVDIPSVPADSLDVGLAAGFGRPAVAPRSSLGDMRPVLLKAAEDDSGLVVKPRSDAMPAPSETGDRYRLDGEIARGGMGAVLRGRDVDLGRDLAVKVLLEKYVDRPEVARRFIEEAQIGGQLQHPGVVPVYDIGRFGDRPFFTMKLVKGQTLASLLAERADCTQDRPRLLNIALQVAQTLAYAHAKGVIHRDLKPANVMVGAFGEVQVMDWGLAKVLAEGGVADEEKASRLQQEPVDVTTIRTARSSGSTGSFGTDTEAGSLLGTPAYMPPEQANGDIANLDRRADVFGLGAILCEVLTGKAPYVGRSSEEVRRKACNGDLADALGRLDGCGADAELIVLTKSCLSPEAIDRPKDAREVADGLSAYLNGVQERLRQAELAEAEAKARAIEEGKRRRLTLALAATVLLALTLGGGGWMWVRNERDARLAQTTRDVNEALKQATALREKAKTATTGGAALFAQAREQTQRAVALVENGPAEEALNDQVQRLRAELDEEEKDRALVTALDEARLAQAETLSGENRFASERAVPKFREAFAAYGLRAGQGEPAAAAVRIRQRPAAVQEAILAALDEWNLLAGNPNLNIIEPHRDWLQAVVAAAEPEDAWRRQVRAARAEKDAAKRRAALEQLAALADVAKVPARTLTRLAGSVAPTSRVALLQRAQAHYPGDFWINQNLGRALQEVTPPEHAEAVRFLTAAAALRPDSPGCLINLGNALRDNGQVDEAIACYQKAIDLDPKYAWAHSNLSLALIDKGRVDEAIACGRQAIALDPKDSHLQSNLGIALKEKGQMDEAIACYQKALELDPRNDAAYGNLGIALKNKGQVDEAFASFQKAIELNPKNAIAFCYLAAILCDFKRDYDGAIASARKAITLKPKFATAYTNLGKALEHKGQLEEAIACHRKAIEVEPKNADAHRGLGVLFCERKGEYDAAIVCFQKAIELDPKNSKARTDLGTALHGKGRWEQAVNCWRKAIELDPKNAQAHSNLGAALADKGQRDVAIALFRQAIELNPRLAMAHSNLGNVLKDKGQLDGAIACYQKAIELEPKVAAVHASLGLALGRKGQLDEAIVCFNKSIELDPKNAVTRYNLGIALQFKDQVDEAIASYRRAIELDPKNAHAHSNLGLLLQNQGRLDEAIASYRKAIALEPKLAAAHMNLGGALIAKGEGDAAIAVFRKAIQLSPNHAAAQYHLGVALNDKGQHDEAIACYKKAIELKPNYAEAYCNLGEALQEQGRFAESLAAYRRGHELGTKQPGWQHPSAKWVREAEWRAAMESKLPAFLKGEFQPKDTAERLGLAGVCEARKLRHAAARLYADAFSADPKLADDPKTIHRYNAAASAALAATGQAEDAAQLDENEKARLRKQALDWFRADLAAYAKLCASNRAATREFVLQRLRHLQQDNDLAGLRDAASLAKLPADERAAWEKLWADVAAQLKKAEMPVQREAK